MQKSDLATGLDKVRLKTWVHSRKSNNSTVEKFRQKKIVDDRETRNCIEE